MKKAVVGIMAVALALGIGVAFAAPPQAVNSASFDIGAFTGATAFVGEDAKLGIEAGWYWGDFGVGARYDLYQKDEFTVGPTLSVADGKLVYGGYIRYREYQIGLRTTRAKTAFTFGYRYTW